MLVFAVALFYPGYVAKKQQLFQRKGIKVAAKISEVKKIATSGTGNTMLKLVLEFETDKGTVQATVSRFFSPLSLMPIRKGNTIAIYYLPENPQKVVLGV